jgi:broad-specificity NMP kinase
LSGPGSSGPQPSRRPRRVAEIIGPPGSGKSTVARAVEASGADVRRVSTYTSAGRAPAYAVAALRLIPTMLVRPRGGRESLRKHLNWMVRLEASPRLLGEAAAGLLVFDQGPTYTLVRLLGAAGHRTGWNPRYERWWSGQVARWADRIDLLVFLDAPDGELVARIRDRTKGHAAKELPEAAAAGAVGEARALYESVVGEMAARRALHVLRLDTSEAGVDAVVTRIRRALESTPSRSTPNDPARSGSA